MKIAILTPLIGKKYIDKCKYGTLSKEFYCYKNNYDLIKATEQDYNNITIKNKQFGLQIEIIIQDQHNFYNYVHF